LRKRWSDMMDSWSSAKSLEAAHHPDGPQGHDVIPTP